MLELSRGRTDDMTALLRALVELDGDRLVMLADDPPYVVTRRTRVALPTRVTPLTVSRVVHDLVPPAVFRAFEELGCVVHQFAPFSDLPDHRFTIIASQHDHDVRAEIYRAHG